MFFYGTLKRGGYNHHYCEGGVMTAEGRVRGLLYDLPEGYPALVVPEETILAVGTADYLADARAEKEIGGPDLQAPADPTVHGELYAFDDPEQRLPVLDRLEDFDPNDPSSPYRRVLIPVTPESGNVMPAWAYVVRDARGTRLPNGRWPAQ
jgi:gamma-glutamylcyclotransferase (GGCT)/AIG2-like uncharacterized protein YtfP